MAAATSLYSWGRKCGDRTLRWRRRAKPVSEPAGSAAARLDHQALNLFTDDILHQRRQILVQPGLQQRSERLAHQGIQRLPFHRGAGLGLGVVVAEITRYLGKGR